MTATPTATVSYGYVSTACRMDHCALCPNLSCVCWCHSVGWREEDGR